MRNLAKDAWVCSSQDHASRSQQEPKSCFGLQLFKPFNLFKQQWVPCKRSFLAKVLAVSLAVTMGSCLTGCDQKQSNAPSDVLTQKFSTVTQVQGKAFGTFYYITVPGGYPGGKEALQADARFVFAKVSNAISSFDPIAEIARFNEQKSTKDFFISTYLGNIIENMLRQSRRIDNVIDPTVAPLVNLWGFGTKGEISEAPTDEQIAATREYVGLDKFELRHMSRGAVLRKKDPRVELDLATIGEGLAADELANFLDEEGINNYMIAVAGAIRSKGANPDGKLWRVGIEDPMSQGREVYVAVCPQDMAISTAGSYRNFFLDSKTGDFYSHIIDPATGKPVNNRTVSVSVIARTALETDTLDTGLLVKGAKAAVEWGNKTETPVYAIEIDENGKEVATYSRAFTPYLKCVLNLSIAPVPTGNKQ